MMWGTSGAFAVRIVRLWEIFSLVKRPKELAQGAKALKVGLCEFIENVRERGVAVFVNETAPDVVGNAPKRLARTGVNGGGKTSLFRLILGEERADSGEVYISKDKTIGVLTQDGAFKLPEGTDESLSPLEFMYLGVSEFIDTEERLEKMKYCKFEHKHTLHKETR